MSSTLARTAAYIATKVLTRDRTASHQCFRVKNLHPAEVIQFVDVWPSIAEKNGLGAVKLVVADSLGDRIAEQYVADLGRSITHYRNNNRYGLVYIETSAQSDEQGLQNMFSLRDSNFLDGSFDDYLPYGHCVSGQLIEEAWLCLGGQSAVPELLAKLLLKVIRLVHCDIETVPVRRFVAFAELACQKWMEHSITIDAKEANRIVGESLIAMEIFPDADWNENDEDTRCKRRLELNSRHAELIDGSTELGAEEIALKAKSARFLDANGQPLPPEDADHWRTLCKNYGESPTKEIRKQIPYSIFNKLFVRDTAGLRLGDRVYAEVERDTPSRLPELVALDIVDGLNGRNSLDAVRLQNSVPPEGEKALVDLLIVATRKSIERLASPPKKQFFNPAIEIVRIVQRIRAEKSETKLARVRLGLASDAAVKSPTHGLFVFLFGGALRAVSEGLRGLPGACELDFESQFLEPQPVPELIDLVDDSEDLQEVTWGPLQFRVELFDSNFELFEVIDTIEWCPVEIEQFAFWWLLVQASETPWLQAIGTVCVAKPPNSDDWLSPFVRRAVALSTIQFDSTALKPGDSALSDTLLELRKALDAELRKAGGLDVGVLHTYLDGWNDCLKQAREQLVPDGLRTRELQAFLGCDLLAVEGNDRRVMLALHPVRLRWICKYLAESSELARACLSNETAFADGAGDHYLGWLESRTPRELPPMISGHEGKLLFSRSEFAWCEEFAPENVGTGDVVFDGQSLYSIAQRVLNYLDAHPYKRDGLSLLVVLPTSNTMPADLLQRISDKVNRDLRISLHVAAPRSQWESIARNVEDLSVDLEGASRTRLFPDRDLALIEFEPDDSLEDALKDLQIDIAIVTHFLQRKFKIHQFTENQIDRPGEFNPLFHRPSRLETRSGGVAISQVLLPKLPDLTLESWSTLTVRAHHCRPVSPSQPENTDFVELPIRFQDSARLFRELHIHSHWVVTLERYISREQIESDDAGAPDVLSIEEGVGANGLGTLIVSSRFGGDLIRSRLVRKLKRFVPEGLRAGVSGEILERIASKIYDSTRRLTPRLALQALGVARVTEEILGLMVARRLAERKHPLVGITGLSAWLSLDEHTDWFGGPGQVRADMCRLTLSLDTQGEVRVDLLALEGKLRQRYDGHGETQVHRTCEFFRSILNQVQNDGQLNVDGTMWRELIAKAIESLPREAVRLLVPDKSYLTIKPRLREDLLSRFRSGDFQLGRVDGVYSICLWDNESETLESHDVAGIAVLRSTRFHLLDLVQTEDEQQSPDRGHDSQAPKSPINYGDLALATQKTSLLEDMHTGKAQQPTKADALVEVTQAEEHVQKTSMASTGSTNDHSPIAAEHRSEYNSISGVGSKGLTDAQRRRMYEDILGCFTAHGLKVLAAASEDVPYVEGPASVLFKVRPAFDVDPRKLAEKSSALKLALKLEQEQNVSFNIDRGYVTIDVPKKPEQRYFVDAVDTWARWNRPEGNLCVPLGEDRVGGLVELNFSSSNSPHLLVAGTTGSGKSEALNTILFGLAKYYDPSELRLMLVDPKGTELIPFEGSKFLDDGIGWDDADALRLLQKAVTEMQRRYGLFRSASKRSIAEYNSSVDPSERLPWWLIVLDEYADLTHDPQAKKEIEAELQRLAQKARASGLHVIIATQKPSAGVISTNLRANLPAQLALRVKSAVESRVVIDEAGAENLNGKGDAILKADGKIQRVQCSRVDPETQRTVLESTLQKS